MLNKDSKRQIIPLQEMFEKNISSRQAVEKIQNQFEPAAKIIVLDFAGIEFVSRSFAHELIRFSKSSEKEIEFVNFNPIIRALFSKVRAVKPAPRKASAPVKVTTLEESSLIF